jgi:hypothetical protein
MPRYYFHLANGKQVLSNHNGIDLPGDAAARTDALGLRQTRRISPSTCMRWRQ